MPSAAFFALVTVCGFIGGAVRAALGIRKYHPKHGKGVAIISSGIVGAFAGTAFISFTTLTGDAAAWAAGLAGYVGADVVESLYKIRIKRKGPLV
jgi:hypothetical protein